MTTPLRDPEQFLLLEYELDAPPEKVWRAVTTADLREQWLPNSDLVEIETSLSGPQREACYRMRESDPPYVQNTVIFQITPLVTGGTCLRIIQQRLDVAVPRLMLRAANTDRPASRAA